MDNDWLFNLFSCHMTCPHLQKFSGFVSLLRNKLQMFHYVLCTQILWLRTIFKICKEFVICWFIYLIMNFYLWLFDSLIFDCLIPSITVFVMSSYGFSKELKNWAIHYMTKILVSLFCNLVSSLMLYNTLILKRPDNQIFSMHWAQQISYHKNWLPEFKS